MKSLKLSLSVMILLMFSACTTLGPARPVPPTLDEIVSMSKAGTPAEDIIKTLKESRAVYAMTAADITSLHDKGVPDSVLDYMHKVYLREVREDEAERAYNHYGWYASPFGFYGGYFPHGRWRGGIYYGW
ncbi:MAG: hypothetical protein ABIP64_02800 [Burkholderiales bacterium]